jgi:uroporphyrinogen-III synthase
VHHSEIKMKAFQQASARNPNISNILIGYILLVLVQVATSFIQAPQIESKKSTLLAASSDRLVVAVTREDGKNSKLVNAVERNPELTESVELVELPCIEHASGPDINILGETLKSKQWDYIAVTSPEAAKVLASEWDVVRDNPIPVAAVGKATEQALKSFGIPVAFTPSKATAKTLAAELAMKGEETTLLYPASAKAKSTLETGLKARGFEVTRLNTYDTVTATWSSEQKVTSQTVKIACFGSPSSVDGWLSNTENNNEVFAACIGETSAEACRGHGWEESRIFFPESPGIEGWVETIRQASLETKRAHAKKIGI